MNTQEIRKLLDRDKLIIGLNAVRKAIKDGTAEKILAASNAPAGELERLTRDARMTGVQIEQLGSRNDQLGIVCRKPHPIAFFAVKK